MGECCGHLAGLLRGRGVKQALEATLKSSEIMFRWGERKSKFLGKSELYRKTKPRNPVLSPFLYLEAKIKAYTESREYGLRFTRASMGRGHVCGPMTFTRGHRGAIHRDRAG